MIPKNSGICKMYIVPRHVRIASSYYSAKSSQMSSDWQQKIPQVPTQSDTILRGSLMGRGIDPACMFLHRRIGMISPTKRLAISSDTKICSVYENTFSILSKRLRYSDWNYEICSVESVYFPGKVWRNPCTYIFFEIKADLIIATWKRLGYLICRNVCDWNLQLSRSCMHLFSTNFVFQVVICSKHKHITNAMRSRSWILIIPTPAIFVVFVLAS